MPVPATLFWPYDASFADVEESILFKIVSMEARGSSQVIRANVPLGEMFGYATHVRGMTQGRGSFTMEFEKYAVAPRA
jgi:translation elongation factor EF-G